MFSYIIFTFELNAIHLYSMVKKEFQSQLFRRKIEVSEPDYWSMVYG